MKNPKTILIILLALFFLMPAMANAFDYGFIISQNNGFGGPYVDNISTIIPHFSALLGNNGYFFASAGLSIEIEYGQFFPVPEILSTYLSWQISLFDINIGRMNYIDPLGYVAAGLFDGAGLSVNTQVGTFNVGVWYSGLIYKKRTNIAMTDNEKLLFSEPLVLTNFFDTFFSPARLISVIEWEHMDFLGLLRANAAFIGQSDLSGAGTTLNSQYLIAKASMPLNIFNFSAGLCLEFIQENGDGSAGFAADLGVNVKLPTKINDDLSFLLRFSTNSFLPISSIPMGNVFNVNVSGITLLSLKYNVLLHRTFSAGVSSTYFIRNDAENLKEYASDDGNLLGNEFYLHLNWRPFSDLQFGLGSGVFLPALGNAAPNTETIWRLDLSILFSF
jgi:hypothetical protein